MTNFSFFVRRFKFLGCVVACTALHLSSPAVAQPATRPAPAAAEPAGTNAGMNVGTNAVTQAAVQQGIFACASRINQVTTFLGFNAQAGVTLMVPPGQADQRLLPLAMETITESGPAYVSATFAPGQANGCGATYDAVTYWPQKCEAVAAKQFALLKRVGNLKKEIAVLDGGLATKVFLMPAGNGCISIKKEIVL